MKHLAWVSVSARNMPAAGFVLAPKRDALENHDCQGFFRISSALFGYLSAAGRVFKKKLIESRTLSASGVWVGVEARFHLGEWLVEPNLNFVTRNGEQHRLQPKVMRVLVCLAEAGEVVPKERLMREVWTDTFVTDDVLTRSISELRKVFNDDPKQPRFIQTIPKGGYRLLLPATPVAATRDNGHSETVAVAPPAAPAPRIRTRWIWIAVLVAVAIILGARLERFVDTKRWPAAPNRQPIIAVLPFQNLSTDPDQDYFADGLTAEMISQLGRLPSDQISVIAWNSMIRYKGARKGDDAIASELRANYLLEGTVRRSGNHVRITAELVHIGDRSHIWAKSYDGELGDVLNLQSRLAGEIADDIRLSLTPGERQQLVRTPSLNGEGLVAYLRGKFPKSMNSEEAIRANIANLQRSIELNPGYASGYAAMATSYRALSSYGFAPRGEVYPKMRAALETAQRIDPNNEDAHREMAWLEWRFDWNFPAAENEMKKALELNQNDAVTHSEYALFLKSQGRYDEALQQSRRNTELSPLDSFGRVNLATVLALMGQYGAAEEEFRKVETSDPGMAYLHERWGQALLWQHSDARALREFDLARELSHDQPEKLAWLALGVARTGDRERALQLIDRLNHLPKQQYLSPFHMSLPYIALGDNNRAMDWLERAYREHDEWLVYLKVYPEFDPLRSDPRFQSLVKQVGLQ